MLIINSFVVFSITLIITKARILSEKREFVELRYLAAYVGKQKPGWVHKIWHAIWNCPMCSGFWMALPVCLLYPTFGFFIDVLAVFGANWLLHCIENALFYSGQLLEKKVNFLDDPEK